MVLILNFLFLVVFVYADQDSLGMRVTGSVVQGDMKGMSLWG